MLVKKILKRTYFAALSLRRQLTPPRPLKYQKTKESFPSVLSVFETIELIQQGFSLCRYGDAEFDTMLQKNINDPYQNPSNQLSERLSQILKSDKKRLLISIPPFYDKYNDTKVGFYSFWEWYWVSRFHELRPFLNLNKKYGNALVSRTTAFHHVDVSEFNKIWEHKEVVLIRGRNSRFIFDERVFKEVKLIAEIFVPATNAYSEYDRILSEALEFDSSKLFLVAAGPTATVLCFDLHESGRQALDIGHLTNCYLEYIGEASAPESYPMEKSS